MKQKKFASQKPIVPLSFVIPMLVMIGLTIYSNTFQNSFHLDDLSTIINNKAIRHLGDLHAIWAAFNSRFILGVSFALNYAIGKLDVFGYHLFNITIHVLCALLVHQLTMVTFKTPRMSKSPLASYGRFLALSAALIFLTHPIQTQAVNYIWQRAASLATLFYLASLICYVEARLRFSITYYLASLSLALLGMFTKEITFTLPLMILGYDLFFLYEPKNTKKKRALLLTIPFLLTLPIIPLMWTQAGRSTIQLMRPQITKPNPRQSQTSLGMFDVTRFVSEEAMPRQEYMTTQLNVIRTYVRLLLFPVNQNLDYDYPRSRTWTEPSVLFSLLFLVGILVSTGLAFKKHRLLSFGIFWFFLALCVESLVPQQDVIFEHRLYLPMVGYSLFLGYILCCLFQKKRAKTAAIVLMTLIVCYSILTFKRNFVWKDELTLWNDVVQKSPNKTRPYWARAGAYEKKRDHDKAIIDYNKALELSPRWRELYNNRGLAYKHKGDLDQALSDYNSAIKIDPDYAEAYYNRGNVYQQKGYLNQALLDYDKALELNPPSFSEIYNNRAVTYFLKKEYKKSWEDAKKALGLEYPVHPQFLEELRKKLGSDK